MQKAFDSMQVTLTEKGISTKDIIGTNLVANIYIKPILSSFFLILVACQTGVIMEIPWILIDPRRPVKMTEVERYLFNIKIYNGLRIDLYIKLVKKIFCRTCQKYHLIMSFH